jgi:hypothetical protein
MTLEILLFTVCTFVFAFIIFIFKQDELIVEEIQIPIKKEIKPLRIVHLSDFHFTRNVKWYLEVIEKVNSLKPDMICLTGDFITDKVNLRRFVKIVSKLKCKNIFAVQGNWDYSVGSAGEYMKKLFEKNGINLLINSKKIVEYGGQRVCIIGIDDFVTENEDIEGTLINISKNEINIILSHAPGIIDLIDRETLRKIDIILAGHTHGGQVYIPFCTHLWLPYGSEKYVSGLFRKKGTLLYVTRGLGTSLLPIRFFCNPEISYLTLSGKSKGMVGKPIK